jgi:hypothetical protein
MRPVDSKIADMWTQRTWVRVRQQVEEPVYKTILASTPNFMHHVEVQLRAAIEHLIN